MNADRAREIFIELIANVAPDRWRTRLMELVGEDRELHGKVERLLTAYRASESFLEQPAPPLRHMTDDTKTMIGLVVADRYKLLEQIGDGGMGSVWTQSVDEPFRTL